MASSRSKRAKKPDVPTVVRRAPGDRKRLPPELEEFARSDEKRLPPPRRRPRLHDPRAAALIPGVANRDARLVFDYQLERTREWLADEESTAQADEALAVLWLARLWRGRSLTSFAATSVEFLELSAEEAKQRAERGAEAMGLRLDPLSEEATAIWVRALAALIDAELPARIRPSADGQSLVFELEVDSAPEALLEMGRRMNSLVEDRRSRERAFAKAQGEAPHGDARERPDHDGRGYGRDDRGHARGRDDRDRGRDDRDRGPGGRGHR